MVSLGAPNKLNSLFKVIPNLQETVNDLPQVFHDEQLSLTKPEVPELTFLFILIKSFVDFFFF